MPTLREHNARIEMLDKIASQPEYAGVQCDMCDGDMHYDADRIIPQIGYRPPGSGYDRCVKCSKCGMRGIKRA